MKTKITYSNDSDYGVQTLELTVANESNFDTLLEAMQDELDFYNITYVGCPQEDENSFTDSFAICKDEMLKADFMKTMRGIIKGAKKSLK